MPAVRHHAEFIPIHNLGEVKYDGKAKTPAGVPGETMKNSFLVQSHCTRSTRFYFCMEEKRKDDAYDKNHKQ
jgi:hypothetical protein